MKRMIECQQNALIRLCLKYKADFDLKSSRVTLSGHFMEESLEDKVLLSDFVKIMLELNFVFPQIKQYLLYLKEFINFRELFVLFAVNRKVILMSYLLNCEEFYFKFAPYLLADVMANDIYDIAMLLYREYFLEIKKSRSKSNSYLIGSFRKTGMLDPKCYMMKRVANEIDQLEAIEFLDIIEARVEEKSKSNIFVISLNPVKNGC